MHSFYKYVNPYLGKLLKNIRMDKSFIRGEGCYLYDSEGNKYLDCIAAYGALPFGYNPQEIWECINGSHLSKEPSFIQPSFLETAGELAKRLIEIVPQGLKYVTFTNSGAETAEAAIKLCRSATGRKGILATRNSFHGKTLGALSATGKSSYQAAFGAPVEGFNFIDYGDADSLKAELELSPDCYAAFIVEPIQGEGGIVEPPKGYLRNVKDICDKYGVLLIIDEIQTGLGRTGSMFACEQDNVCPDVLLLAKALGGGIMPIGACISSERAYNEEFALKHSSTFAGNSLACRIGIKVLDMLTGEKGRIIDDVKSNGRLLKDGLLSLKDRYPDIIRSIRGRGFMLGIEFGVDTCNFPNNILGIMSEKELLTPVISSYLLNKEYLRVAPTLNGNSVIRIEPPLIMTGGQCSSALEKIENMLKVLDERNSAKFLSFLVGEDSSRKYASITYKPAEKAAPSEDENEGRFAFLVHPLDYRNYPEFDESLSAFSDVELSRFSDIWNNTAGPFVISKMNLTSQAGKKAYGEFICILRTAEELMQMPREQALSEVREAINIAKERGAKIVGLGAYTSVVSMGGLYLKDEGMPLTTGNSYTVVSAVDAINSACERLGILPEDTTVAVIGAAGSIGRGTSILLSEMASRIILIGNPGNRESSIERLYRVAAEIYRYLAGMVKDKKEFRHGSIGSKLMKYKELPQLNAPESEFVKFAKKLEYEDGPVIVSTSINEVLPLADVVVSATNSVTKLINRENIKFGAIVCDVSRPANVSEEVAMARPDVLVIDGGVVEVPGLPSLGWNFGFEKGLAYACMAETMMLALEHHYTHTSLGSSGVSLESILLTRELAQKHGFKLANLRTFNRPLTDEKWESIIKSRKHKGFLTGQEFQLRNKIIKP